MIELVVFMRFVGQSTPVNSRFKLSYSMRPAITLKLSTIGSVLQPRVIPKRLLSLWRTQVIWKTGTFFRSKVRNLSYKKKSTLLRQSLPLARSPQLILRKEVQASWKTLVTIGPAQSIMKETLRQRIMALALKWARMLRSSSQKSTSICKSLTLTRRHRMRS